MYDPDPGDYADVPDTDVNIIGPVYDAMVTRQDGHDPLVPEPLRIRI